MSSPDPAQLSRKEAAMKGNQASCGWTAGGRVVLSVAWFHRGHCYHPAQ